VEIQVITIFPEMCRSIAEFGVIRQAVDAGQLHFDCLNPRDFVVDKHRSVDDRPYGGGPGMLLRPGPLAECIDLAKKENGGPVVYLTPQGRKLDQMLVNKLGSESGLILLAGRYEGIDERVIQTRVDYEVSVGDYVLSGGELGAMIIVDAISRLLPGVLGNELSAEQDSFAQGMLDYPHYTRPEIFEDIRVPSVLLSGDHEKIGQWRLMQALIRTKERRPDLFSNLDLDQAQIELLNAYQLEMQND